MPCQLIVHDNDLVAEEAAKAVQIAIGEAAEVVPAHNFERARELLHSPRFTWSLVVVGAHTPASCYSTGAAADCGAARKFIRDLKAKDPTLPVIALAATPDLELSGLLSAYENSAALIDFGSDWRDKLVTQSRELRRSTHSEGSVLDLEITLEGDYTGQWSLKRGGRVPCAAHGSLHINSDLLDELVVSSEDLGKQIRDTAPWLPPFNSVASKLKRLLFTGSQQNEDLWLNFVDQRARVGGTENTRIVFTMAQNTQPMIVEALKDMNDYWMLKAPIIRQYNCAGGQRPLFKEEQSVRGPINCLIIDADPAEGVIDDAKWQGKFEYLSEADAEASRLVEILETAAPWGIGRVDRLQLAKCKGDPIRAVLKRLDEGPWHLVHFVGHALMSKRGAAGLVLQAGAGGVVLPFDALTAKLLQTQLLFVSSCQSATSAFLTSTIQNVVPAVLGYRWPVEDYGASQFADAFYTALFNRGELSFKSLEYAFVHARKSAYKLRPDEATWASPMLLLQLRQTDLQ